jgi:hypothetical protein
MGSLSLIPWHEVWLHVHFETALMPGRAWAMSVQLAPPRGRVKNLGERALHSFNPIWLQYVLHIDK